MSNPSLLCVPYRFKTSKLYSQIPDSGLGDFSVTRSASNVATRVNAAGLIETVLDNVPRLDYPLGGISAGCPALLVEPSGTNLCPRSQEIDLWSPTSAITTPNAAISPDGTQNAELFVPNSGSNGRTEINVGTLANATTYTMTCFMKQHTASLDQITLYVSDGGGATGTHRWGVTVTLSGFTLSNYTQSNGSVTSTSIENYGNGWYRVRVTGQVTSGMTSTSAVAFRYFGSTANGTNGVLVYGVQFEQSSIPTSYIPTTTGSVTRGAETVSKTGVSSLIGQTEGTLYAEVDLKNKGVSISRIVYLSDGTSNNEIRISHSVATAGDLQIAIRLAGNLVVNQTSSTAVYFGINKIAVGYKVGTNEVAMYVNGSQIVLSTSTGNMPACSAIHLGSQLGSSNFLNDRIRAAALYTTRLPNTGTLSLQSLTQ
jgi:hypothetical protein